MSYTTHYPVLKNECLSFLTENVEDCEESYFADLTFGGGGHSSSMAKLNPKFLLKACDQDPDALKNGNEIIEEQKLQNQIELIDTNFSNFPEIIEKKHEKIFEVFGGFQGILMDLGVSSHHFDQGSRGFSFKQDAPLDMRMNNRDSHSNTASDIVNSFSEDELVEVFSKYGEERFSKRIASEIIIAREKDRIETTKQLENIIFHCYPKKLRYGRINPSTKCFQALRIVVNSELQVLQDTIPRLIPLLRPTGRLLVISFHSLEDRIVKNQFKELSKSEIPCKILTKRPVTPTEEEIAENSRSRSAKLRVIERI